MVGLRAPSAIISSHSDRRGRDRLRSTCARMRRAISSGGPLKVSISAIASSRSCSTRAATIASLLAK